MSRTATAWRTLVAGAAALVATLAANLAATAAPVLLDFTPEERALIASHGPWPPARERDTANRAEGRPAAIAFGRQLFFDVRLSADGRMACATCHQPARGFQDGLARPAGRDPARPAGPRNTQGLVDVGLQRWFGWDGGDDSLWAASLKPLFNADEMGHDAASLAAALRRDPARMAGYRRAFGHAPPADDLTLAVDIAKALAAYQATLVSPRTAFDQFRDALQRGDAAAAARYPAEAQRGLKLFVGRGRCSVCHAGPGFTNGEFADIGVPFFVPAALGGGVDGGRHAGLKRLLASPYNRLGPFHDGDAARDPRATTTRHVMLEPRHFGEFRVPTLRGLAHTAPFMHDGSRATIEDAVRHYSELNEERLHADGERILRRLDLTPAEAADLAAFLRTLSR